MTLRIERYAKTRFWALYDGEDLVVVTVYKKGAQAVQQRLAAQPRRQRAAAAQAVAVEAAAQQARELAAHARLRPAPPAGLRPGRPPGRCTASREQRHDQRERSRRWRGQPPRESLPHRRVEGGWPCPGLALPQPVFPARRRLQTSGWAGAVKAASLRAPAAQRRARP